MEKVYGELDEAKAEIESLKADCRKKAELNENLRSAYNEQLSKFQEAREMIEKQTRELSEMAAEASETKQACEDLKFIVNKKEYAIGQLIAANDKIRVDCDDKLRTWDEEKRELVLALDEVKEKIAYQEQMICALRVEVKDLKSLLLTSQKKSSEVEEKAKLAVEMRNRDELLTNLEEEHRKIKDQFKWKNEQFTHLKEAHEKLREEFRVDKKEWELEKSALLDEICSVQTSLDSQTRISEDLQNKLQVCNQALAHEESRRKYLEIQLSDVQTRYDNVVVECDDAKSKIECFTSQRDSEIASLRNSLCEKETLHKELEYRLRRSELENQDLLMSVKELQEAGINRAGTSSSLVKLRNKLKSMEQAHKDCFGTLKVKEAEWCSRLEKMTSELSRYKSKLAKKDGELKKLKFEFEDFQSSMMELRLQYEENSVLLLALESGISDAKLEIVDNSTCNEEREEQISNLMKQLETKNSALVKAEADFREEHAKTKSLLRKVESLNHVEEQRSKMQEDLERYRRLLEESSKYHFNLEDKLLRVETESKEKLSKVCDALDKAESELAEKYSEGIEVQFEMFIWKSIAGKLKTDLEDNHQGHKELEASLHAQIQGYKTIKRETDNFVHLLEDKNRRMHNLELQAVLLEKELEAVSGKQNALIALESDKLKDIQILKHKDDTLKDLEYEIERLELECLAREFEGATIAQLAAERAFASEKLCLVQLVEDKENQIANLLHLLGSAELKLENSLMSSSLEVLEKQAEINLVYEAWEKISAAHILASLEIEEKNMMIIELQDDIRDTQQRVGLQEKLLCDSKQKESETEAKMKAKQLEMKMLGSQMELKLENSGSLIYKLESENKKLLEDIMKLLSEKEILVSLIEEMGDKISIFSDEDMQLMGLYGGIMQSLDREGSGLELSDELARSVKENVKTIPLAMQNSEVCPD